MGRRRDDEPVSTTRFGIDKIPAGQLLWVEAAGQRFELLVRSLDQWTLLEVAELWAREKWRFRRAGKP